jgi:hypothetical protein
MTALRWRTGRARKLDKDARTTAGSAAGSGSATVSSRSARRSTLLCS